MRQHSLLPLLVVSLSMQASASTLSVLRWEQTATSCDMNQPVLINATGVVPNTCTETNGVIYRADCLEGPPGGAPVGYTQVPISYGKMKLYDSMAACHAHDQSPDITYLNPFEMGTRLRQSCSVPYDGQAYAIDCTGSEFFDGSVQRQSQPFNISVMYWKDAKRCDANAPTTYAQQSVQNGLTVTSSNGYSYTVQCWDNAVDSTYSIYVKTSSASTLPRYQYLIQAQGDSNNACEVQRSHYYNYDNLDQQLDSFAVDCTGQNNFQNVFGTKGNRVTSALVYPVHQLVTVNGKSLYATSAVCDSDADCPLQATCTDNQCICKAGYGGDNTCNNKVSSASVVSYTSYSVLMIVLAVTLQASV